MSSSTSSVLLSASKPRIASGLLTLILFSLGHFCVDLYSGAIGVLQPVLIERLGMTLTHAGVLGGMLIFSSSVTQPLYGYLSDRFQSRMFSALSPAIAGLCISSLVLAPSYSFALALVFLGGVGISSFHPQGSSWAAAGAGSSRGRWMAVFVSAGTLGYALSPAYFKEFLTRLGADQSVWAAVPGVLTTIAMLLLVRPPSALASARKTFDWQALHAAWRPLSILYFGVFFRSAVQVTYAQFLVLYLTRERSIPSREAAYILAVYLAFGAIGGFLGGHLADRFGAKRVIVVSFAASVPFMAVFFLTNSFWGIVSLIIGGFILLFTIPVNVVLAQEFVPQQAGTVSALLMGFAWGMSGVLFIPFTGWLADQTSLHFALRLLLIFPVLGWWLTRKLPENLPA